VTEVLPRVVVVATEETARRWAHGIRDAGIPAVACAWSTVADAADPGAVARALGAGGFDLVWLTSANALRSVPAGAGTGLSAAAVGDRTSREAKKLGFTVETVGRSGSEALAKRLAREGTARRVLWLRGETALEGGAAILRAAGREVTEVVAYRTTEVEGLGPAIARLGPAAAYVLGSPAAADAVRRALGPDRFPPPAGGPPVVVLGDATASALAAPGRPPPVVADSVEVDGLVRALRSGGVA
jgi:uroporphyrinogen-III synthase